MHGSPGSGLVAIVDDDASVRAALVGLFKAAGLTARAFGSAEEYLHANVAGSTGCVVTDVRMPGMSGLELQARLAAWYSGTPVVFITAHEDAEARRRALQAGARGFFQKPFDDEVLVACVRTAVDGSSTHTTQEDVP